MKAALETRLAQIVGEDALDQIAMPRGNAAGNGEDTCLRVAPDDEGQWTEIMALATGEGLAVLPMGGGTKTAWTRPPERVDLILSTGRFGGIVSHEPGDGTVTVRAGTTMQELRQAVEAGGHLLSPDVPCPDRATVGGVVAAGQSGVDRLRHGPVRNLLLGTRVVLPAGVIAKSGGRLVKNVTGYDLHRLHCGSAGTLCVVLEASFRLLPAPASQVLFTRQHPSCSEALDLARRVLALPIRPLFTAVEGAGEDWTLSVALIGRERAVERECEHIEGLGQSLQRTEGPTARSGIDRVRDAEVLQGGKHVIWASIKCHTRLSRLGALVATADGVAMELEESLQMCIHPGLGMLTLALDPTAPMRVALVEELRATGAEVHWRGGPGGPDPFGGPPAGLDLMRDLKHALDPKGTMAAGRIHGGI